MEEDESTSLVPATVELSLSRGTTITVTLSESSAKTVTVLDSDWRSDVELSLTTTELSEVTVELSRTAEVVSEGAMKE